MFLSHTRNLIDLLIPSVIRSEANKVVNGYASAFLSKTQPPDMKSFLALNERIRAKNQVIELLLF